MSQLSTGSVLCKECHAYVASLSCVRLVMMQNSINKSPDTPLVIELQELGDSVKQSRPHHEGNSFPYKKGKLRCVCENNLGNIQNNITVLPYRGTEVGLLKFQGICFSVEVSPGRAFTIPKARVLSKFVNPTRNAAHEVTPDHVLDSSDGSTKLKPRTEVEPPATADHGPHALGSARLAAPSRCSSFSYATSGHS